MSGFDLYVRTKADLIDAVERLGIVPLFGNSIPGFSVEEHVARGAWFDSDEGVWEWKGPVIRESGCAYGKLFENKAAFVRTDLYAELANYRRDGYDMDARYDDGLAPRRDLELWDLVAKNGSVLSKALKAMGDYGRGGKKGFDTILTRLQRQCYVVTSDFVYETDRAGRRYGWGVAQYALPETLFGEVFTSRVYVHTPEESRGIVLEHLKALLPGVEEKKIVKFLG